MSRKQERARRAGRCDFLLSPRDLHKETEREREERISRAPGSADVSQEQNRRSDQARQWEIVCACVTNRRPRRGPFDRRKKEETKPGTCATGGIERWEMGGEEGGKTLADVTIGSDSDRGKMSN